MVRKLTPADFPKFLELLDQLWSGKRLNSKSVKCVYDVYLDSPDYLAYGFERNKELVGVITASIRWAFFYQGKVAIIEDLVVRKDVRSMGIGTTLIRETENILHSIGLNKIELCSDLYRLQTHRF